MIGPNLKGLEGTYEIVSPLVKCKHDGEEFFVIDLVVSFCNQKRLG